VAEVVDLVEHRHRAVVKAAKRARRSGVPGDFHRLRIRCKRLRYSLEFTADLYGGRTERFTRRLAKVQDQLGLMQDAEVATTRLLGLARTGRGLPATTVFAMGGVAERYRREAAELLGRMPARLKVLGGAEWRSLAEVMEARRDEARALVPPLRLAGPAPDPASHPDAPGQGPATGAAGHPGGAGLAGPAPARPELPPPPAGATALAAWPDPVWGPPPDPGADEGGALPTTGNGAGANGAAGTGHRGETPEGGGGRAPGTG
jgi:hypothetical protein